MWKVCSSSINRTCLKVSTYKVVERITFKVGMATSTRSEGRVLEYNFRTRILAFLSLDIFPFIFLFEIYPK